tara:strand:- start:36 stop:383 length:348 start_codon:yes stop_codon:yes gene_type:complete
MTGGGIFLHISHFILDNNFIFFLVIPFSIFFILKLCNIDLKNNLLILALVILSIPQYTVYHKYLDPLIIILSLTIFNFKIEKNFFIIKNINFMFGFYLIFYLVNFVNHYLIEPLY